MMKRLAVLGALLLGIGVAANGCVVHPRVGADVTFSSGHHHHDRPPPRVYYVERHDHYDHYGHGGYHRGGPGPRHRHWWAPGAGLLRTRP